MTRIGLIADTHHYLDEKVFTYFKDCDEIWHAGDFGKIDLADQLHHFKPLKGVYGNIDGYDIRSSYPKMLEWMCEGIKVLMTHIGGYPPRYTPFIKKEIHVRKPQLFISGHSHILKVKYDNELNCLHMNPGAAGIQGWHQIRTLIRFCIDNTEIKNCEVIELGDRKIKYDK